MLFFKLLLSISLSIGPIFIIIYLSDKDDIDDDSSDDDDESTTLLLLLSMKMIIKIVDGILTNARNETVI